MSPSGSGSRRAIWYLILVLFLVALVVALAVVYYYLSRPPELDQTDSEKDRNYEFSIYGFEGDLLRRPSSVDVDEQGNIYVADTGKKRIVVFDEEGGFVTTYGDFGKEPLQIWEPIDVAVAPDGRTYVVDKGLSKIVIYDTARTPTREITFDPNEPPLSVTIANDNLFVTTPSGVLIGSLDGDLLTGYIAKGKEPGQFDLPGGVAVGEDGTLYIADSLNYRVQAVGTDGTPLWQYGTPLPPDQAIQYQGEDRKFGLPASIAVDENGYLYVVDGPDSELVVLTTDGEFVETIGDVGHADGTFYYPDGIAYSNGRLVIADKFNDRVEVFRVPVAAATTTATRYIPWLLLLLLIPLLVLFLRRGPRYVAAPEFVSAMQADVDGPQVARSLGKLNVAPALAGLLAGLEGLKLRWRERSVDDDRLKGLIEQYKLDQPQAEALDVALGLRGKRILLAETQSLRDAAGELGVATLTYEEVAGTVVKDRGGEGGAAPVDASQGESAPAADAPPAESGGATPEAAAPVTAAAPEVSAAPEASAGPEVAEAAADAPPKEEA